MLAPSQHVQKIQRNSPKILDFIYLFIFIFFMLANSLALNDMRSDIGCETHSPPSPLPVRLSSRRVGSTQDPWCATRGDVIAGLRSGVSRVYLRRVL